MVRIEGKGLRWLVRWILFFWSNERLGRFDAGPGLCVSLESQVRQAGGAAALQEMGGHELRERAHIDLAPEFEADLSQSAEPHVQLGIEAEGPAVSTENAWILEHGNDV